MPAYSLDKVKLLCIQFSFQNEILAPASLWGLITESKEKSKIRIQRNISNNDDNLLIFKPFPTRICLSELPSELLEHGWELVDASIQTRVNDNFPEQMKFYVTPKFYFAPKGLALIVDDFDKKFKGLAYSELQSLCDISLWRLRLFRNPYYENGQIDPNFNHFSINCEEREPRFENNGQIKIEPLDNLTLSIDGDAICLGGTQRLISHIL